MNEPMTMQQRADAACVRYLNKDQECLFDIILEALTAQREADAKAHAEEVARLRERVKELEGDAILYSKALWKFGVDIVDVKHSGPRQRAEK